VLFRSHAQEVLSSVEGIAFHYLTGEDIVRHPLVQEVIRAYHKAGNPGREG